MLQSQIHSVKTKTKIALLSAKASLLLLLVLFVSSPSVQGNLTSVVDCSAVIVNMAGCLSFVTIGSNIDKLEGSCCSGLKQVLGTKPECLCEGLKNSGSLGIKLNITKASTLPDLCKLVAPPLSSCGLSTTPPGSALAPVPAAAPGSGPSSSPAPSPSEKNQCSSVTPISGLVYVISSALVILFSFT